MRIKTTHIFISVMFIVATISLVGCTHKPVYHSTLRGAILENNKATALSGYAFKKVKSTNYGIPNGNCNGDDEVVVLYRLNDSSISGSFSCGCSVSDSMFPQDLGGGCVPNITESGALICMATVCKSCGMTVLFPTINQILAPVDR